MYNRDWAEEVYAYFYKEHIFAVREIHNLYNIATSSVIELIQNGDPRWRAYKKLVKHAEECVKMYWKHFHTAEGVRENYYTFDKYLKAQFGKVDFALRNKQVDTKKQEELFF